jgi:DNA-binding NarL/FixJ family response regulator
MTIDKALALSAALLGVAAMLVLLIYRALRRGRAVANAPDQGLDGRVKRLEKAAERIDAKIRARMAELRELLQEADKACRRLDQSVRDSPDGLYEGQSPLPLTTQQEEVLRLHRQGLESIEISRQLDLAVGEVELTLNLHRSLQEGP